MFGECFYDSYFISAYTCEAVGTHDRAELDRLTSFGKYKLNSVLSQYFIDLIKKLAVAQLVKINSRLLCKAKVRRPIYDSLPEKYRVIEKDGRDLKSL